MQPLSNALHPVIEEIQAKSRSKVRDQEIIYLDEENKLVDPPKGIRGLLGRYRAFLVTNSNRGAEAERRDLAINVPLLARNHELRLDYRVQCPPKHEAQAAEALGSGSNPQTVLENLLSDWAREFVRQNENEAFGEPDALRLDLERYLSERVLDETGLVLRAHVHLNQPRWARLWNLESVHFPVRAKDADLEVDLQLEGEFRVEPEQRRRAAGAGARFDEVRSRIPQLLAAHAVRYLTLHQIYAERDSTVEAAFRSELNRFLEPYGRCVDRLRLSGGPEIPGLSAVAEVAWDSTLAPTDHPSPVPIEALALLTLTDVGAYVRNKTPDLQPWFEGRMSYLEQRHLRELGFAQLRQKQIELRNRLSSQLVAWAARIGYEARCEIRWPGLPEPETKPKQVQSELQRFFHQVEEPAVITIDCLIHIEDVDRYAEAGSPGLGPWVDLELDQIVTEAFHGLGFTDLCLRKRALEETIDARLQQRATETGLGLESVLKIAGLPFPPLAEQVRHRVPLPVPGLAEPAGATIEARFALRDAEAFLAAEAPRLQAWTAAESERIVEDALFGLTLTAIYKQPDAFRAECIQQLQEAALSIGYAAEVLIELRGLALDIPTTLVCNHWLPVQLSSPDQDRGQVVLEAQGLFELAEAETFIGAERPELKTWFEQQVEETAAAILFGIRYAKLCLESELLQGELSARLTKGARAIGYHLTPSLVLDGVDSEGLGAYHLTHTITIVVPGASQEVKLEVELLLELADRELYTRADVADVEAWARQQMKSVADATLFGRWYRELSVLATEREEATRKALVERAGKIGYAATARVTLHGLEEGLLEPIRPSNSFPCRLRGYDNPVQIEAKMILQVEDTQTYIAQGCPDLEAWARKQVPNIVEEYLFSIRYTDLCIHLDTHKAKVEKLVKEAALSVGVRVEQLTTFTNLFVERLRRGLEVRIEDSFPTSLASVPVGLDLKAEIRVPDLSGFEKILDKHPELVEHIESTVRRRLEQELRQIDPAVFYTEFQAPTSKGSQPVNQRIETAVREVLEEFQAEILDISCRQQETELSLLLSQLTGALHPFEVIVQRLHGEPELEYHGALQVEGIDGSDGWHTFRMMTPEPDDLIRRVVEHLNAKLMDARFDDVFHSTNEQLQAEVQSALHDKILADLGLRVRVANWRREPLAIERKTARRRLQDWEDGLDGTEELRRLLGDLRKQLYTAIASGQDDDRVDQLQTRIKRLEEEAFSSQQRHSILPLNLGRSSSEALPPAPAKALGPAGPEEEPS